MNKRLMAMRMESRGNGTFTLWPGNIRSCVMMSCKDCGYSKLPKPRGYKCEMMQVWQEEARKCK